MKRQFYAAPQQPDRVICGEEYIQVWTAKGFFDGIHENDSVCWYYISKRESPKIKYLKELSNDIYSKGRSKSWRLFIETIKLTPTSNVSVQVARSLVVSVIAFIVDFSMLVVFKEVFGIHYLIAAALSFCLGVVVNYYLSVKWVFADRKFTNKHAEFTIFFVITAIGLGLNLAIIAGMVQQVGADYRLAKVVSTVIVFFWNFIVRKKVLY